MRNKVLRIKILLIPFSGVGVFGVSCENALSANQVLSFCSSISSFFFRIPDALMCHSVMLDIPRTSFQRPLKEARISCGANTKCAKEL